jgi:hypothetical protein
MCLNSTSHEIFLEGMKPPERETDESAAVLMSRTLEALYPHSREINQTVDFLQLYFTDVGEPSSSVGILSGYGLDDRGIEGRSPADARDISSKLCVQIGSEAHPASCPMGTGGLFRGGKARSGRDADHSAPSSAEVKK